jgi:hypothetical protein
MATRTTEETNTVVTINGADGNVSVTDADKEASKAKVPNINFNVNVQANYDKIVALAAAQYDEDGNPYSVHRFAKETLFATLGLTMDGEVLRKKVTAPKIEDSLLAKAMGADKVKSMTAGDRAKKEKQLVKGLSDQLATNPELMAAVMAAMAKLDPSANRQEDIDSAQRLAK